MVPRLSQDDIIVVTFSRFSLECITGSNGAAYDYVKLYDGATALAPVLASFYCTTSHRVVTTGRHLLVHFHSDVYLDSTRLGLA